MPVSCFVASLSSPCTELHTTLSNLPQWPRKLNNGFSVEISHTYIEKINLKLLFTGNLFLNVFRLFNLSSSIIRSRNNLIGIERIVRKSCKSAKMTHERPIRFSYRNCGFCGVIPNILAYYLIVFECF